MTQTRKFSLAAFLLLPFVVTGAGRAQASPDDASYSHTLTNATTGDAAIIGESNAVTADAARLAALRAEFAVNFPGAAVPANANAQQSANAPQGSQPAAPSQAAQPSQSSAAPQNTQSKRILGIIPNFQSVSAGVTLPPMTPRQKIWTATESSFDYTAFIYVAIQAGIGQATNSYREFGTGGAAYGRYYWHFFADSAVEDYVVQAAFPIALHQDPRYYTLGHGGFFHRAGYAVSRLFITRTDGGDRAVNFSELVGAGAAAGISSLYYPSQERTWTKVGQRWLTQETIDGAFYAFQEFWPDIRHAVFHQ
jgi:hypothetical protein